MEGLNGFFSDTCLEVLAKEYLLSNSSRPHKPETVNFSKYFTHLSEK